MSNRDYDNIILTQIYLCGEAMGYDLIRMVGNPIEHTIRIKSNGIKCNSSYWPITDDVEAMALMKKFKLIVNMHLGTVEMAGDNRFLSYIKDNNINYAIVECVSKMQHTNFIKANEKSNDRWRDLLSKLNKEISIP